MATKASIRSAKWALSDGGQVGQWFGPFAVAPDGGVVQFGRGGEVAVDRAHRKTGPLGHLLHARKQFALGEQLDRHVEHHVDVALATSHSPIARFAGTPRLVDGGHATNRS